MSDLSGNIAPVGMAAAQGFANPLTDASAGIGLVQTILGLNGLSKVPAYQQEQIDPKVTAMVDRSLAMAKQGYSPEEITNFHNATAQGDTMRFMKGTETGGGNLAQVVNNVNNVNDSNALNNFAAKDAALKLANQHYADQSVKYLQQLKDKSWMNDNNHINALNNSWGGAAKQGLSTLTGALEAGAAGYGRGNNNNNPNSLSGDTSNSPLANVGSLGSKAVEWNNM